MMVARIPSPPRPRVKPATGMRLFWSVIRSRFRASIPPVKRTSTVFRATPVAGSGTVFLDHLVDGHARRDHGVHVGLRVDVEVEHGAPFLLLSPPDGLLDAVALADRTPREAIGGGESFVVWPRYGRLGVTAVVEELLPLADHPEVAVVQDGDLYVQPELLYCGKLLDVHLDAAVAGDNPDGVFGISERHAHRRRQREAHRAEAAARDVAVRLRKLEELGSPHLVLTHVRDDPQIRAGRLLYGFHHLYRTVLVPRRFLAPPLRLLGLRELFAPLVAPFALRNVVQVGEDRAHRGLRVGCNTHGRLDDLAELGGIDVDVDHLRVRGELVGRAGDPVVEAHPDREQEVGAVDGAVHAGLPVHPRPAQIKWVIVGEGADAQERRNDRDAGPLGEQPQLHLGAAERHAVSGQDQGPLRAPQEHRRPLQPRRLHGRLGLLEAPVPVVGTRGELHVFGDVDEDRPRPAGA